MNKKINIFFWWSFWIIFLELIYKIFILKNVFSINTFYVFIFSIPFIVIMSLLTSIFKNKVNERICIIVSTFLGILFLAQIVYFNFYYSMFSLFSLTAGGIGQVAPFIRYIIRIILSIWYIFVMVLVPLILYIIYRNKFEYKKIDNRKTITLVIIYILFLSLAIIFDKSRYSYKKLFFNTNAPLLTVNKSSLLTMEIIDINRYFFGFKDTINIEDKNIKEEYDSKEYNVINIDFNELISKEKDNKIISMHNYFKNTIPTKKNEYTGVFKDKNIILINAESFDTISVDEELTPTLYKMINSSFVFNNYYQPLFPISTYDGEYMNLTSLIPKEGSWSLRNLSNNSIPFVYGNMFKNNGYKTYAFHNYKYNFYEREYSHPKYGFEYIACGNGLEKYMDCNHWPNSDLDMINATKQYLSDRFAIYYLTVSGHLDYNFDNQYVSMKNKEYVKDLNYSTKLKAYLATEIELDKAMEKLLNYLEEEKLLDDTLIVISPDHYPYGLSKSELNEISKKDRSDKFENHHTSLIMYNPKIKKTEINKFVSGIDIMPTIYNLFGLEYDSRLLMGRDVFSDSEGIVILSDRSWITEKGSYNSITNEFIPFEKVDDNYFQEINDLVNERFSISSMIIDYDYYSKLGY